MLRALSPLDGRYAAHTEPLQRFFSEEALIRARLTVEVAWFLALAQNPDIRELPRIKRKDLAQLMKIIARFSAADAEEIKRLEKRTNHDVKAVEYFLRQKLEKIPALKKHAAFLHFALTSEDVNNLAYGMLIMGALKEVARPQLSQVLTELKSCARRWGRVDMLALTHGQPATPTTVGREFQVFAERLERQMLALKSLRMQGKFGGAVGTYSAHRAAYPKVQWEVFGRKFVRSLGLTPLTTATQINPHDDLAELSHVMERIDTILLDLARDLWLYISRGVFSQKVKANEVGSSTMPHKVNPIDFENAEGNLGLANALFVHFAAKLPISRLQRDLSDSTVQRSIGSAFGYQRIALTSLLKGLSKLTLNKSLLARELDAHPEVRAEAIQTLLRKHGIGDAYERLKKLTRGRQVTHESIDAFIDTLPLPSKEKQRLKGRIF
ncbi:adenylosuccinate lyase [Candidatus Peregrinibacteria bacterium CG10_big_fil_rev_8_21_14_0_10_55_24]|nr:MAG: adenylosuccinate lyase [Candidatus Peregrinibacteria bacterium CG10_big_fil_rev_8_21_14_0_10_55_24]